MFQENHQFLMSIFNNKKNKQRKCNSQGMTLFLAMHFDPLGLFRLCLEPKWLQLQIQQFVDTTICSDDMGIKYAALFPNKIWAF
jgi:hypothetical protein